MQAANIYDDIIIFDRTQREAVPPPTSTSEVRSFLEMTGFSSTSIPDYAVTTTPLRKLTCKDVPFVWMKERQDAFQHLKDVLTQQTIMALIP